MSGAKLRCASFGLRVGVDPLKGRGLYCERDFAVGDTLLHCWDFSCFCRAAFWAERCAHCLCRVKDATKELLICNACGLASFCSNACRNSKGWHFQECMAIPRLVSSIQGVDIETLILAARVLRVVESPQSESCTDACADQSESCPEACADTFFSTDLQELTTSLDPREASSAVLTASRLMFAVDREKLLLPQALHRRYSEDPMVVSEVVRAVLQVQCNSLKVTDHTFTHIADVCDPLAALVNHSCEPNAVLVWQCPSLPGEKLSHKIRCIRALRPGDEILVAYIEPTRPWWVRQPTLQESYGFLCVCKICTEIVEYRKRCPNKRRGQEIPDGVRMSVDSVANCSGILMGEALQSVNGLCDHLRLRMGLQIAYMNESDVNALSTAMRLISSVASDAARIPFLNSAEAKVRLDQLREPVETLRRLLGPRNAGLKILRRVMLLAEACRDWRYCNSLTLVVVEALGSRFSPVRADTEALGAKAGALYLLENSSSNEASSARRRAIDACDCAIATFLLLHGEDLAQLPRARELQDVLQRLHSAQSMCEAMWLDSMD